MKNISKDIFKKVTLIKKLNSFGYINKLIYRTHYLILNIFLKLKISIYNGHFFFKKYLNKYKKGFKLGEFIWTRKIAFFKKKQKKTKKKKTK